MSKRFCFSVVYELEVNKFAFTFAREIRQIQCTCLNLMLVQCTRPCGPRALDASKFSARALDLSYFTRKSKCAFINLYTPVHIIESVKLTTCA